MVMFAAMGLSAHAASFSYCLAKQGSACTKYATDLGDFLTNASGTFYPALGFYGDQDWIYFRDSNFQYFTPTEVVEGILSDGGAGGTITYDSWTTFDKNLNKIPDDIDQAAGSFKTVADKYFGSSSAYKFIRWWETQLPVFFLPLQDEGILGYFDHSDADIGPYLAIDIWQKKYATMATIAHEVFHSIQYGYLGDYMGEDGKYDNFIEGTAVLMQSQVVTWDKGYLGFLEDSPSLAPEKSIFGPTAYDDYANYGSFVWYSYLHKAFGRGIVKDMLEEYSDVAATDSIYRSFIAIDNALQRQDSNITEAFLEYVTWNYDYSKYTDGKNYKPVKITKTHTTFPTEKITISNVTQAPHFFASNYIEFDVNNRPSNLTVNFTANNGADMYVTFLSIDSGKVDYDNVVDYLVERGETKTFIIPSDGSYDKIVMIVSVINIDGSSYDVFKEKVYPYAYSAERDDAILGGQIDSSMENVNLADYFIFSTGASWRYKEQLKTSDGKMESSDSEITTTACSSRKDCVTYVSDGGSRKVSYQIFGDSVYGYEVDGKAVKQAKVFSKKTIAAVLEKDSYPIWGLDEWDKVFLQASQNCSYKLLDSYTFGSLRDSAVEENCTISLVDSNGGNFVIKEINHYLKGIGLVDNKDEITYGGAFFASSESYLTDTSLSDADLGVSTFSDLAATHKNRTAIMYLKDRGIINGYSDGTFKPDKTVNRAELLKILVEGKGVTPDANQYGNCFKDVKTEWFAPYVCYAKEQGWVTGYSDGNFRPAQTVNKVESLKMLLNSQDVATGTVSVKPFSDVGMGEWFAPYVSKAKELGILEETGTTFGGSGGMKRAGICENLYRLLTRE